MWLLSDEEAIKEGILALKNGDLVAFPTETVYGLGANGLSDEACQKIYRAKGRPSDNPLILHISSLAMLEPLVKEIPLKARALAEAFWPGALTMVFLKESCVPSVVSGGLDTVAIRYPKNDIALKLIEGCQFPLAAPSANKSGKPSPTKASHVQDDFSSELAGIIDGGQAEVGVESTVIDMTANPPIILRPGGITKAMIEQVIGEVAMHSGQVSDTTPKAPGMKYRHYAPDMPAFLVDKKDLIELSKTLLQGDEQIGLIFSEEALNVLPNKENLTKFSLGKKERVEEALYRLFDYLREANKKGLDRLYIERYERIGLGESLMNRIEKLVSGQFDEGKK